MKILKFIFSGLMIIICLAGGILILLIYLDFIKLYLLQTQIGKLVLLISAALLISLPILFLLITILSYVLSGKELRFVHENGQLVISKKAIVNFLKKVLDKLDFIKKVLPKINITKKGVYLTVQVKVYSVAPIEELRSIINENIKNVFEKTIGTRITNINILIKEIAYKPSE
jgi:hypothetical protein